MIVMKFGGASLASPGSIRRVASIVHSQMERGPIVVVSALGNTTDRLVEVLACASRADSYLGWKLQERLQTYHFCLAEDLLSGPELNALESYLRHVFRDLHVRMLELCEGERSLTPELQDWVLSIGEQLSSRIVTAALRNHGISARHVDARTLILTDTQFTRAEPRYWETYAKIRWSIPSSPRREVAVLGGFIGATEDGRTTTLGRGGSDLTASLVGAALDVDEIQIWKDVDGLLTWDPKIKTGGYRVKQLSYDEMAELASAGATILHPSTIAPAQRLRIPVTIRNTFRPECEGTKIGAPQPGDSGIVKSIACKSNVSLLELRSPEGNDLNQYATNLERLCKHRRVATLLGMSREAIYVAVENNMGPGEFEFDLDQCTEVHVRSRQAILTLVGQGLRDSNAAHRLSTVLASSEAVVLTSNPSSHLVCIAVPAENLTHCLEVLERTFFTQVDPQYFADSNSMRFETEHKETGLAMVTAPEERRSRRDTPAILAWPGARA